MIILCNTKIVANTPPQAEHSSTAFLLAQVGARAAQEFASLLAPLKLTPADAGILRLLRRSPGISQQNLARALDMHASRLVAVIDALEKRGLLVREPHAQDRRVYSLRLTGAGEEMLRTIGQIARGHNETMCSGLDAEERSQLGSLLKKIAAQHGLQPGVHPGYKNLGQAPE
jgi:DNA-binding MarR family transcriptional regulator